MIFVSIHKHIAVLCAMDPSKFFVNISIFDFAFFINLVLILINQSCMFSGKCGCSSEKTPGNLHEVWVQILVASGIILFAESTP